MHALISLWIASLKGYTRDRGALVWTLVFPVALLGLFAVLYSGGSAPNFPIAWVDASHTAQSAQLRAALDSAGTFTVTDTDADGARELMKTGRARAIVEAGPSFGTEAGGRLQLHVDLSDRGVSGSIVSLVDRAVRTADGGPGGTQFDVVPAQERPLSPISYLIPTILAMALMQLGIYGAVTLAQQRDRQVLKRFATAPIDRWSIVGSFVGARLVIAAVQAFLLIAAGKLIAGADLTGNLILIAGLVLLTALTFVGLGFAVASIAKNEEAATQLSGLVSLPLMFLSGLFIPIDQLPDVVRPIASVMPLTYASDALRQAMVGGIPTSPLPVALGVLAAWLAVSLAVATRRFRWQ